MKVLVCYQLYLLLRSQHPFLYLYYVGTPKLCPFLLETPSNFQSMFFFFFFFVLDGNLKTTLPILTPVEYDFHVSQFPTIKGSTNAK